MPQSSMLHVLAPTASPPISTLSPLSSGAFSDLAREHHSYHQVGTFFCYSTWHLAPSVSDLTGLPHQTDLSEGTDCVLFTGIPLALVHVQWLGG